MTMFWNRVKSPDRKTVYHRMNMHHPMTATIDITIGTTGLMRLSRIVIDSVARDPTYKDFEPRELTDILDGSNELEGQLLNS